MKLEKIISLSMLLTACVHAEKAKPISQEEIQKIRSVDESLGIDQIKNIFDASVKVRLKIITHEKIQGQIYVVEHNYGGSSTILRDADENNYFALTAAHVVFHDGDYMEKEVMQSSITVSELPAKVFKYDHNVDLALLMVSGKLEYFKGKLAHQYWVAEPLISIGFPDGQPKTIFVGELLRLHGGMNADTWYADLRFVDHGASGSGVYFPSLEGIQLTGIIVSGHKRTNASGHYQQIGIVSLQNLRQFLEGTPVEDEYL